VAEPEVEAVQCPSPLSRTDQLRSGQALTLTVGHAPK
jgi:hypothetical protein